MKKLIFLIPALLIAVNVYSQRLYFCEEYRNSEEIGVSDVFIIGSNGGYFTCMLDLRKSYETINTRKVSLDIYRITSYDDIYISTEKFDVQPDWDYIFFDKFYTFYTAGKYRVKAYRSDGSYIAAGSVTIKMR